MYVCVCREETLPAAPDNLLLSHCVIFHFFDVDVCVCVCPYVCVCTRTRFCAHMFLPVPSHVCVKRLRFIYSLVVWGPDSHWQLRSETERPASSPLSQMTLPTDLTVSSSRSPSQASSSSSSDHHNNAFLPLMTHRAWLHNSHRHIASTRIRVCLWCI